MYSLTILGLYTHKFLNRTNKDCILFHRSIYLRACQYYCYLILYLWRNYYLRVRFLIGKIFRTLSRSVVSSPYFYFHVAAYNDPLVIAIKQKYKETLARPTVCYFIFWKLFLSQNLKTFPRPITVHYLMLEYTRHYIAPDPKMRAFAIFLLLTVGNYKIRSLILFKRHNIHNNNG
jgi:hypothetical protein